MSGVSESNGTGAFSNYHPVVNFTYFTFVLIYSMFFLHPVFLLISLVCAFAYSIKLKGNTAVKFNLLFLLPMLLICALINPAFNHEGATILCYLQNGNPLTLESIIYGIVAATMLVSVICWFSCYNVIMTSDKFIYLFGRIIPAMSLILSMVLRFVPRFITQTKIISNAQRCIGRDISTGSIWQRARQAIRIISILITWALENAIETADSMKSRGYGLPGRTAFALFRWESRDKRVLGFIIFCGLYVLLGSALDVLYYRYFPTFKSAEINFFSITIFIAYLLLCTIPLIIEITEDRKWKRI